MFVWILFWGFLVHGISFANADALSNENINLFDDTDSLDPTYSNLISDNNLNIPDMFFNDEDDVNSANSFVSDNDIGINNSLDSTLLAAGCSSISTTDDEANLYSGARRKSRIRRGQEMSQSGCWPQSKIESSDIGSDWFFREQKPTPRTIGQQSHEEYGH